MAQELESALQEPVDPPERDHALATGALVQRARAGDGAAMAVLLERYAPRVLRVVRRRLGPDLRRHVDSGDVVQETMVEVVRSIGGFQPRDERSFLRWLAALVENRLRNLARKGRRQPLASLDEAGEEPQASGASRTHPLDRRFERELLAAAMEELSEDHRRVLRMRHEERLPFKEIGERTGRSEDAAWVLHKRAKSELARRVSALRRGGRR